MGRLARHACGIALCLLFLFNVVAAGSITFDDAVAGLPKCALECLGSAISNSTCAITDVNCICSTASLNNAAAVCMTSACTVRESLTAKNITSHLCGVEPDNNSQLITIFAVFISLTMLAVALRVLARILTSAYFWWDDLFNLFGLIGCIVFTVLILISVDRGMGLDVWFVAFPNITEVLQLFFIEMLLYTVTRFFVRASIILFYLRVFPAKSDGKLGRMLMYTLVANLLYNLAFFFAVVFQCAPVHHFWDQWEGDKLGHCGNVNALVWSAAITGIVFDLWLLALPFPQLLALNLHWKKKVMGCMMFGVGACVLIISLVRLKSINEFTSAVNPTKDIVQVCVWSGIELNVGVICPCLPSFRLLIRRILPHMLVTTDKYEMDSKTGNMTNPTTKRKSRHVPTKSGHTITKTTSISMRYSVDPSRSSDEHRGQSMDGSNSGSSASLAVRVQTDEEARRGI
ncbi:hypothetical protein B0T22DRAFT_177183 [Podospora appendiculata]|uniref:CFEM domain-containing protein n=1 Tax=Podospora appendiculata TaxID=314037 RepID=A0AAE0XBP0_9PEZI|nr:hypothetical protein B0T22DRAFT_177183 [Podospora appendiculata]